MSNREPGVQRGGKKKKKNAEKKTKKKEKKERKERSFLLLHGSRYNMSAFLAVFGTGVIKLHRKYFPY